MLTDQFIIDKATIRGELERRARERRTITYGEAALMVGRVAQGLGRILDAIKTEERGRGQPDLGALVVSVGKGVPTHVGRHPEARAKAIAVQEAVWLAWAQSAP